MTCGQGDTRVQPGGHDDSPTSVLHVTALPHAPRSIKPNAPLKGYRCTEANCTSDGCTASQLNQCKMKSKSRKPTAASLWYVSLTISANQQIVYFLGKYLEWKKVGQGDTGRVGDIVRRRRRPIRGRRTRRSRRTPTYGHCSLWGLTHLFVQRDWRRRSGRIGIGGSERNSRWSSLTTYTYSLLCASSKKTLLTNTRCPFCERTDLLWSPALPLLGWLHTHMGQGRLFSL